jgi:hypothetical protein
MAMVNMDGTVYNLCTDSTMLYICGSFTTINGTTRNNAAAVIKQSGSLTAFNPNTNGEVRTIVVKNDVVYMGGSFTSVKGQERNYAGACTKSNKLAAWAPNTNGAVNSIIINTAGTSAFLAGAFTTIKGKARHILQKPIQKMAARSTGNLILTT